MPNRRFPPPWSVEDIGAAFVVTDSTCQQLAYVYFEDEPGRRSAKLLAKDEARRTTPPRTFQSSDFTITSRPASESTDMDSESTLKELQRVKADALDARTDAQNARASEALTQRKLADTEADLKRAKEEAGRASKEAEQAKTDAKNAQEAKTQAERKLADAEAARSAAEERLKASESAAKNQRGFGARLAGSDINRPTLKIPAWYRALRISRGAWR